jgi:hypothetical protein
MNSSCIFYILIFLLTALLFSCSGSDDQREFERQAMQQPSGFTHTDASGAVTGSVDRDDWRIAPFFQGLVEIEPAYPNPVLTTEQIRLEITVTGIESVRGLQISAILDGGYYQPIYTDHTSPLNPGLKVVQFSPLDLSRFDDDSDGARGLKRILIFDGNNNLISYGDIMVE